MEAKNKNTILDVLHLVDKKMESTKIVFTGINKFAQDPQKGYLVTDISMGVPEYMFMVKACMLDRAGGKEENAKLADVIMLTVNVNRQRVYTQEEFLKSRQTALSDMYRLERRPTAGSIKHLIKKAVDLSILSLKNDDPEMVCMYHKGNAVVQEDIYPEKLDDIIKRFVSFDDQDPYDWRIRDILEEIVYLDPDYRWSWDMEFEMENQEERDDF